MHHGEANEHDRSCAADPGLCEGEAEVMDEFEGCIVPQELVPLFDKIENEGVVYGPPIAFRLPENCDRFIIDGVVVWERPRDEISDIE